MGENPEHRDGPRLGFCGDDSGAVADPLTPTDVKPSRAEFDGRKPE